MFKSKVDWILEHVAYTQAGTPSESVEIPQEVPHGTGVQRQLQRDGELVVNTNLASQCDVEVAATSRGADQAQLGAGADVPAELVDDVPMPLVNAGEAQVVVAVPIMEAAKAEVELKAVVVA